MSDEIRFSFEPPPELVALGRAAHRLIEQMLVIDEDSPGARADLVRARRSLEEVTEALARHACTGEGLRVTTSTPAPGARRYYVQGPLVGDHHPLNAPAEVRHENGVTSGRVKFGLAFEGPPGNVHGGFVAHFFDQVLGHHNVAAKIPAMTGTLSAQGEPIAEAEGLFVLPRQPFDGYAQRPPRDQEPSGQTGADHE